MAGFRWTGAVFDLSGRAHLLMDFHVPSSAACRCLGRALAPEIRH